MSIMCCHLCATRYCSIKNTTTANPSPVRVSAGYHRRTLVFCTEPTRKYYAPGITHTSIRYDCSQFTGGAERPDDDSLTHELRNVRRTISVSLCFIWWYELLTLGFLLCSFSHAFNWRTHLLFVCHAPGN